MLAACRDLARMDRNIRAGTWQPLEGVQLFGKTLGIIGLGGIGAEVARIAKGIGMEVIAWNRTPRPTPACRWSSSTRCWRSPTSSRSISTLNDETRGFIDAKNASRA